MAGADYFLRAVQIYDDKLARDDQIAFRDSRAAENDRRYEVGRNDMLDQRAIAQENFDKNYGLAVKSDARQQQASDIAAQRFKSKLRAVQLLKDMGITPNPQTESTAVTDAFDATKEGTTFVEDPQTGDFNVMETLPNGEVVPQKTYSNLPVKVPYHLMKSGLKITNAMDAEQGNAFFRNNAGLVVNEETGMMEYPDRLNVEKAKANDQQAMVDKQPAMLTEKPDMSALNPFSDAESQDTSLQSGGAEYLSPIGKDSPNVSKGAEEYKHGAKLSPIAKAPVTAPTDASTTDAAVTKPPAVKTSTVTTKDTSSKEALDGAVTNLEPTKETVKASTTVSQNGGVVDSAYTKKQRREIAATMYAASDGSPASFQSAQNFIETGDASRSKYDVAEMQYESMSKYMKSIKSQDEALAKLALEADKVKLALNKSEAASVAQIRTLSDDIANDMNLPEKGKDGGARAKLFRRLEATVASSLLSPTMFGNPMGRTVMRQAIEIQQTMERNGDQYPAKTFAIGLSMAARNIGIANLKTPEGQRAVKHEVLMFNDFVGGKNTRGANGQGQTMMDEAVYGAVVAFDKLGEAKQKELWGKQGFRDAYNLVKGETGGGN